MIQAINNMGLIRIPLEKGKRIYSLPYATSFENKVIKRIVAFRYENLRLLQDSVTAELDSVYVTLRNIDNGYIVRNFPLSELTNQYYTNALPLDTVVNWETSYIETRKEIPADIETLYLYVIYDDYRDINPHFDLVKSVVIPVGFKGKFSDLMKNSNYGYLKRITIGNITSNLIDYKTNITLNCRSGRSLNYVSIGFFCAEKNLVKQDLNYIADYDVEWDNSYIDNYTAVGNPSIINLYFGKL